jgi:hypothetical protein
MIVWYVPIYNPSGFNSITYPNPKLNTILDLRAKTYWYGFIRGWPGTEVTILNHKGLVNRGQQQREQMPSRMLLLDVLSTSTITTLDRFANGKTRCFRPWRWLSHSCCSFEILLWTIMERGTSYILLNMVGSIILPSVSLVSTRQSIRDSTFAVFGSLLRRPI